MPVVHRESGYTFYFVMADLREPPHLHIGEGRSRRSDDAKFWIDPVEVSRAGRFNAREIARIAQILNANQAQMLEEWRKYEQAADI